MDVIDQLRAHVSVATERLRAQALAVEILIDAIERMRVEGFEPDCICDWPDGLSLRFDLTSPKAAKSNPTFANPTFVGQKS